MESQDLSALFARALEAAGRDAGLAARLLEQRLHRRRPEDAAAREGYLALDELLWEQLAAEACATLGPRASQAEYLLWIRRRLAAELLD